MSKLNFAIKVINSCKTHEQLDSARKWVSTLKHIVKESGQFTMDNYLVKLQLETLCIKRSNELYENSKR